MWCFALILLLFSLFGVSVGLLVAFCLRVVDGFGLVEFGMNWLCWFVAWW